MNFTLMLYDLRKVSWWSLLVLMWCAYVLAFQDPFWPWDSGAIVLGMLCGTLLCTALFYDGDGTEVWVFTRGLTRRQIFLTRTCLGLSLLLLASLVPVLSAVLGLRIAIHSWNAAELTFVRWFELHLSATYLLFAVTGFCAMLFLRVLTRLEHGSRLTTGQRVKLTVFNLDLFVVGTLAFVSVAIARGEGQAPGWLLNGTVAVAVLTCVSTVAAARRGFRHIDVE